MSEDKNNTVVVEGVNHVTSYSALVDGITAVTFEPAMAAIVKSLLSKPSWYHRRLRVTVEEIVEGEEK